MPDAYVKGVVDDDGKKITVMVCRGFAYVESEGEAKLDKELLSSLGSICIELAEKMA